VLRVAAGVSSAASYAVAAFAGLRRRHHEGLRPPDFVAASEPILRAMRDELRARDIAFLVVGLPFRRDLAQPRSRPTLVDAQLRGCESLGIRTLDAAAPFREAERGNGAGAYFLPGDNVHFSPEGHRLVADWLAPRLGTSHGGESPVLDGELR
jgi:hypothetical protein